MKKLFLTLVFVFLAENVLAKDIIADVNGLVCEFCAATIEKVFNKRQEVKSVKVDLVTKKVTISLKDGQNLSDEEIGDIIKNNGYNVVKINR